MNRNTHLRKPYDRQTVLEKLPRHNVRPIYIQSQVGPVLSHFEVPEDAHIGLRLWAYIDSTKAKVVRV